MDYKQSLLGKIRATIGPHQSWKKDVEPSKFVANCEIILSKGMMETLVLFDKGRFDSVLF